MLDAIKKFEIHLDHDIDEQYQYEPGESLAGKIVLNLAEDLSVKAIKVQIRGEAMVSLDDDSRGTNEPITASEVYVDESLSVLEESTTTSLQKGPHSFPFDYTLPASLPSSFIGKYGNITYVVKATIKQGYENQVGIGSTITSEPFLVLRRHDLKSHVELFRPRSANLIKNSKCSFLFCMKGCLEAEFTVAKTGLLPGEDIVINAHISNNYPQQIITTQAVLTLNSTFHARNEMRQHTQIVHKKVDNLPIDYGSERQWTDLRVQVPPFIPESKLDGCVLIDIQYVLQLRVVFEDDDEAVASIPVVIGTPMNQKQGKQMWDEKNYPISNVDNFDFATEKFNEVDINVNTKDLERFRHPMIEGETKDNILFQED